MHGPVKACLLDEKEKLWQGRATWMGFPGDVNGKEPTCQCRKCKKLRFDPWIGKILWKRVWQPTPEFLPGEAHGQKSLEGYSP